MTTTHAELWATSHARPAQRYEWPRWWIALAALVESKTIEAVTECLRAVPCEKDNATLLRDVLSDL